MLAYERPQGGSAWPVIIYNDNLDGEGEGDDEVVDLDLAKLPARITRVILALALNEADKKGQNLGQVSGLFMRLMTLPSEAEIARLKMPPSPVRATAAVMGELVRGENNWVFMPQNRFYDEGLSEIMAKIQL